MNRFSLVQTRSIALHLTVSDEWLKLSVHLLNFLSFFFLYSDGGQRVVYGTDDGVYVSDLREVNRDPVKVLALLDVLQVDVLEDYQLLIVLSGA